MRGFYRGAVALLALVFMAPSALADVETIEVNAQVERLYIQDPSRVTLREGIFDAVVDPERSASAPFATIEGGSVRIVQYWANETVLVEPFAGGEAQRTRIELTSSDVYFEPTEITLLEPTDRPEVRLILRSVDGYCFMDAGQLSLASTKPVGALLPPRALTTTQLGILSEFDRVPPSSGWHSFAPAQLEGVGDFKFLIDGWRVRFSNPEGSLEVDTGMLAGDYHRVGQGGHYMESYSFLVVTVHDARHAFSPGVARFEGMAPAPQLEWDGAATLFVNHGNLKVADASIPLNQNEVSLLGQFRADLQFPDDDMTGATFHAAGTGTTSAFRPLTNAGPLSVIAQNVGVWSTFALGTAAVGVLGIQAARRPKHLPAAPGAAGAPVPPEAKKPAGPTKPGIEGLLEHVRDQPLDHEALFELGVELVRRGRPDMGLQHLDRSFRLNPGSILKLLEDPKYEAVRENHDVRRLLGRFQREQQRKVWAGYA